MTPPPLRDQSMALALSKFDVARAPSSINPSIMKATFTPKDAETSQWVCDRLSYLFGGSGNASYMRCNPGESRTKTKGLPYGQMDIQKLRAAAEAIQRDPEAAIQKTVEALSLIDGILAYLGKPSIRHYHTSSLYGESDAYGAREDMLAGVDMETYIHDALLDASFQRLWVAPQITPYVPYGGMLFIRPDKMYAPRTEELRVVDMKHTPDDLRAYAKNVTVHCIEGWIPGYYLVHLWNEVQNHALAHMYGAATIYVPNYEKTGFRRPQEGEAAHILGMVYQDERAFRFEGACGFMMSVKEGLQESLDLALVGSRRLFEEGEMTFLTF